MSIPPHNPSIPSIMLMATIIPETINNKININKKWLLFANDWVIKSIDSDAENK